MTTPKPPEGDLFDYLDKLEEEADAEELARLAKLPHAELLDEMKKEGIDPARGRAAGRRALENVRAARRGGGGSAAPAAPSPAAAPAPTPAPRVTSLAEARSRRGTRIVAFALAAGVLATLGIVKRDELQAMFSPATTPTATTPPGVPPAHEETPQEKAEKLREQALVKVAQGYNGEAEDLLDEAKEMDPGGDEAGRVKRMRGEIKASKPEHPGYAKLPLGPGEHPLVPTPPKKQP